MTKYLNPDGKEYVCARESHKITGVPCKDCEKVPVTNDIREELIKDIAKVLPILISDFDMRQVTNLFEAHTQERIREERKMIGEAIRKVVEENGRDEHIAVNDLLNYAYHLTH